jgi:hypothetical protein
MLTMEVLFAPTARMRDLYHVSREPGDEVYGDSAIDREYEGLVEVELIAGSSAEDTFLHCGFWWSDFYSWADGKILWISPYVFVRWVFIDTRFQTEYNYFLEVKIEANEEDTCQNSKLYVCARSKAYATVPDALQVARTGFGRDIQ